MDRKNCLFSTQNLSFPANCRDATRAENLSGMGKRRSQIKTFNISTPQAMKMKFRSVRARKLLEVAAAMSLYGIILFYLRLNNS